MAGLTVIEQEAMRDRMRELEDKVAQLSARADTVAQPARTADYPMPPVPGDDSEEVRGSRRHLLKLAGATVIGAVAATLLDAAPAAATTGVMSYGTVNDAGTAATSLSSSSTSETLEVLNSSTGPAVYVSDAFVGTGVPLSAHVTNSANVSAAVYGVSEGNGPGLQTFSFAGYGVLAQGGFAPLRLVPAGTAGAPTSGFHLLGELFVDSNGVFYKCVAAGTPGTWVPLYSVVPLPAPVRVLDTTSGLGGITGPLVPGSTVHTTSVLTGSNGIPSGAVGVVGNLAVSGVNGALLNGYGVMTIYPAGGTVPATANINAGAGCFAISNSVTVALGVGTNAGQLSLVWDGGGPVPQAHAFLDVSGYLL